MNRKNVPVAIDRSVCDEKAGDMTVKAIARIRTDFPEKFGIPRQSALVPELEGEIVFEPDFRNARSIKGLEACSHIWLIWQFSEALRDSWTPMVRPPRLGGDTYMGVFATRSPFRPNPLGLSCVALTGIREDPVLGPVLSVKGADLMDGTPIYDIKPYLPYADCIPHSSGGFTDTAGRRDLSVTIPDHLLKQFPEEKRSALSGILSQDPRPAYQKDPDRIYGLSFAGYNVRFRVDGERLEVTGLEKEEEKDDHHTEEAD